MGKKAKSKERRQTKQLQRHSMKLFNEPIRNHRFVTPKERKRFKKTDPPL